VRNYYYLDPTTNAIAECTTGSPTNPEFLFLVNGVDDNRDGYIDSGWDGFNNDYANLTDDLLEWETETWLGAYGTQTMIDPITPASQSPTPDWVNANKNNYAGDLTYNIKRRPVPVQGARETILPGGVVIDATTSVMPSGIVPTNERSRLPIDPNSLFVDFMVNADGQVVPQTIYSTPITFNEPFFHFWLTDRSDVVEPIVNTTIPYTLPMPTGTNGYPNSNDTSGRKLSGERRLVTVFSKSGLITTDTIENFDASGSIGVNAMTPFFDAQLGSQAAK